MGIETGERNVLVISLCSTLVFLARDIFHHGDLNSSIVQHPLFPPHSAKTFLLYPKSQNHSLKAPSSPVLLSGFIISLLPSLSHQRTSLPYWEGSFFTAGIASWKTLGIIWCWRIKLYVLGVVAQIPQHFATISSFRHSQNQRLLVLTTSSLETQWSQNYFNCPPYYLTTTLEKIYSSVLL